MRGSVYFSCFKAACSRGWANDAGSSSHRASTSASFRSSARAPCTRSFRCGPGRRRQFPACPEGVLLPDGRKPPHAGTVFQEAPGVMQQGSAPSVPEIRVCIQKGNHVHHPQRMPQGFQPQGHVRDAGIAGEDLLLQNFIL